MLSECAESNLRIFIKRSNSVVDVKESNNIYKLRINIPYSDFVDEFYKYLQNNKNFVQDISRNVDINLSATIVVNDIRGHSYLSYFLYMLNFDDEYDVSISFCDDL